MSNFRKRRPLKGRVMAARRAAARCDFLSIRRQSKGVELDEVQIYALPQDLPRNAATNLVSRPFVNERTGDTIKKKTPSLSLQVRKESDDLISRASARPLVREAFIKNIKRRGSNNSSDFE